MSKEKQIDELLWVLKKEVAKLKEVVQGENDPEDLITTVIKIEALTFKLQAIRGD